MDAKSLGPIIREWRIEAGFTQKTLGERAGLHKNIVGGIERGTRTAEREELAKLCRALGKSPSELMMHWSRAALKEFQLEFELQNLSPRSQPEEKDFPPASRVDQIIDKIAALVKELYRESRGDLQKMFLDWLAQSGAPGSSPSSPPSRPRKRVSRKRGS
jgi:transcriptional regulator with XRE-family HTH domain